VHTEKLRKNLILKKLSPEQKVIGTNVPVDDKMLFRDNLNKKLTEAANMSKLKPREFKTFSSFTKASYSNYSKNENRPRKNSSRGRRGGYKHFTNRS